ncbi:ankyrin repeat and protein kinase domain-containing protein 1-like isoform X3 [Scyliorhinus torazame]|uniref:ankyrin repeat and protein kinase domain-containing protein 1-like isoform X3 n=1 Tax=Scyliorhinus torazame TaxID=75743 RepID=UPI003B5C4C88
MAVSGRLPIVTAQQLVDRKPIGSGGFGRIWRARHSGWGIDVALKVLHGTADQSVENRELLREAGLMKELQFQHIVRLVGLYQDPGQPLGIVMELMENGSLASLQQQELVPGPLKVRLIHEVALGMNYIHGLQPPLLHLDLNPRNVLLDEGLHAKVADFGLSKLKQFASSSALTSIAGTIEYLPPEALKSDINQYKPIPATDVYSFGILMWSILTGKQPYSGQRPDLNLLPSEETLEKLKDLKELMQKCWHDQPQDRPPFNECRVQTEAAFRAHGTNAIDAAAQVGRIMRNRDTGSNIGRFSDRMRDLSLRDCASDGVGEMPESASRKLYTQYSSRQDAPQLAEAVPSERTKPPAQEGAPNNRQTGTKLPGAKSVTNRSNHGMAPGPAAEESQKNKPSNQTSAAQVEETRAPGLGSIQIFSSKIEGLQVGTGNTMNINKKTKGKKKVKRLHEEL